MALFLDNCEVVGTNIGNGVCNTASVMKATAFVSLTFASNMIAPYFIDCQLYLDHDLTFDQITWDGGRVDMPDGSNHTVTLTSSAYWRTQNKIWEAAGSGRLVLSVLGSGSYTLISHEASGSSFAQLSIGAAAGDVIADGTWDTITVAGNTNGAVRRISGSTQRQVDITGPGEYDLTVYGALFPIFRGKNLQVRLVTELNTGPFGSGAHLSLQDCDDGLFLYSPDPSRMGAGSKAYDIDASSQRNLIILGGPGNAFFTVASTDAGSQNRVITYISDTLVSGSSLFFQQILNAAGGASGRDGEDGEPGPPGNPGDRGATGAMGPAGAPGTATVINGPPGMDGEDGEPGAPGPAGDRGAVGAAGAAGIPGISGDPGPPGDEGEQGPPGATGATGATGSPGVPSNIPGPPGEDGIDGDWSPPISAPENMPWNTAWGEMASAVTSASDQGSVTTVVDVTGLSVTWEVRAGRKYRLFAECHAGNTATGNGMELSITNSVNTVFGQGRVLSSATASTKGDHLIAMTPVITSADTGIGSKTFKARILSAAGTTTVRNSFEVGKIWVADVGDQ